MEEWKPIVCYEEKYQISNYGRVKSLNYRGSGKDKILKLQKEIVLNAKTKVVLYKDRHRVGAMLKKWGEDK